MVKLALGAVVTVVGFVAAYFALTPSVTIDSTSPINPRNPFSTPFTITNDSYFSLTDVEFVCYVHIIGSAHTNNFITGMGLTWKREPISEIVRGDATDAYCPGDMFVFAAPVTDADIEVAAKYHYPLAPFIEHKHRARFVVQQTPDGLYVWTRKALTEPALSP